jgi:hypothetical protein
MNLLSKTNAAILISGMILICIFIVVSNGVHQKLYQEVYNSSSRTGVKLLNALKFVLSLDSKEKKKFSQNGEDGIVEALLEYIGTKHKYYVEFGTSDTVECNTRFLRENKTGWRGLLMDGGFEKPEINLHKEFIRHDNIVKLFEKYNVPKEFDLLSVDTDFKDYWLLKAILEANYRPRIIIAEINTFLGFERAATVPKDFSQNTWDGWTQYFGYSLAAAYKLGRIFGYSVIYCERVGVNCFYIIDGKEGFGENFRISDHLLPYHIFRPTKLSHKPDQQNRPYTDV